MAQRRTFVKGLGIGVAGLSGLTAPIVRVLAGTSCKDGLQYCTPESQGISSRAILDFLHDADQSAHELHSLVIARRGSIVAGGWWFPYRPDAVHHLYSLSKCFTSIAVGFAVAEKAFSISDRVIRFFPRQLPRRVSNKLASLKVRDLLTMSVGHSNDLTSTVTNENDWVETFLALPIEHAPGSKFVYESIATYMLSAIVQSVTNERLIHYLRPRLFAPLGIDVSRWTTCPHGVDAGGWGLSLSTESLAKVFQLYLQGGKWCGTQILPQDWVRATTTAQIATASSWPEGSPGPDWEQGYGYQFWRCRHDAYRGDGAFGQFAIVVPNQRMVIAITSRTANPQALLNLVWSNIVAPVQSALLPANVEAQERLEDALSKLMIPVPQGASTSPAATLHKWMTFSLEPNSLQAVSASFLFDNESCVFRLQGKYSYTVRCGINTWHDSSITAVGIPPEITEYFWAPQRDRLNTKVASAGAWTDADTFEMCWRYFETPHYDKISCRFSDDIVHIQFTNSITGIIASYREKRPVLIGRMN